MIAFKKGTALAAALFLGAMAINAQPAPAALFTTGDLIVSAYGNNSADTSQGAITAISLVEYATTGGAAVLTDTLPTTNGVGGSSNLGVVGQYGSGSEGSLQLSGNGLYLTIGGYSAVAAAQGIQASSNTANKTNFTPGTPFNSSTISLAQSTDANVPRLAVLVDANGNVNSSTEMNDVYSTNNPRSVYSATGSTFYISGQGDGDNNDQGIFYGNVGLNTVTNSGTSPTGIYNAHPTRTVSAYNGNLYYSNDTSSGSFTGIWQFNGMPTGAATATRIVPGNNGLTGGSEVFYSPQDFFFANADTLYVADTGQPKAGSTGSLTDGGIQKWTTTNGTTWTLQYTLTESGTGWVPPGNPHGAVDGQTGFSGLTGQVIGTGADAVVDLYAISTTLDGEDSNGLYAIADTLDATSDAGESFSELEIANAQGTQEFRGVSFAPTVVPEPTSLAIVCLGGIALLGRRRASRAA